MCLFLCVCFISLLLGGSYANLDNQSAATNLSTMSTSQLSIIEALMENKINSYVDSPTWRSTKNVKYLKDFDGNDFILFEYDPVGYLIYNMASGDSIEFSPVAESPYKNHQNNLYYVAMAGYYKKTNSEYRDLISNTSFSERSVNATKLVQISASIINNSKQEKNLDNLEIIAKSDPSLLPAIKHPTHASRSSFEYVDPDDETVIADGIVYYDYYFRDNKTKFAYAEVHPNGDCGYVALSLILGYLEFFYQAGFFSTAEASTYIRSANSRPAMGDIPEIKDNFINYLVNLKNYNGTDGFSINTVFLEFMENKTVNYQNQIGLPLINNIASLIDQDIPVILFGSLPSEDSSTNINHAVVAYGYISDLWGDSLLTHYGWNNRSQVVISSYIIGTTFYIRETGSHRHGYYWLDPNSHIKYCACGVRQTPNVYTMR